MYTVSTVLYVNELIVGYNVLHVAYCKPFGRPPFPGQPLRIDLQYADCAYCSLWMSLVDLGHEVTVDFTYCRS